MTTLKAEKRDKTVKAKALRRQGKITANITGKDLPASIAITLDGVEAGRFLKEHTEGSQVILDLGEEKYPVLMKSTSYDSMKHQYDNIDFQLLVADEKITSTVPVILLHTEDALGFLTHSLMEITYKALPSALVEKVEIDVSKVPLDTSVLVGDLELAKNKDIDMVTPTDAIILHVSEHQKGVMEETDEAAEAEA